jgi:hypothetical protein
MNWRVGSGPMTANRIEGVSQGGDDYVVWRRTVRTFHGGVPDQKPDPPPLHFSGGAKVDLVNATVVPVRGAVPSASPASHVDSPRTRHVGPFVVESVTVVAALDSIGRRFRSVLHRSRDSTQLPDVVMCQRPWGGTWLILSVDGRHVVAACRVRAPAQNYLFDLLVYSTVTGEQVGALRGRDGVGSWVLWHTTLISLEDSVLVRDLSAGKRLLAVPVLSESNFAYPEVVPAPPP